MTAPHPKPDRAFDTTSLHEDQHGNLVHRDYLAHVFRWGFISHKLVSHDSKVLDIGCGVDTPLAKILTSSSLFPKSYLGVDYNKTPKKVFNAKWARFEWGYDFTSLWPDLEITEVPFDLIVCLEVVEHMRIESVQELLIGAKTLLADGGKFCLSTPVFNGKKMARNHINEMTVETLRGLINAAGLKVERRFGTFMSYNDLVKVASKEQLALHAQLAAYYSNEVLACYLAPLYPDASRNNLWVLTR